MNRCAVLILSLALVPFSSVGRCAYAAEMDFPELVKLAEKYQLPQPPRQAPLVLANTGAWTFDGPSSSSLDPGLYRPALLLEKLHDGKARVLMGSTDCVVETSAEHRPATRPYSLVPQKIKHKGYVLRVGNMSSFVTAVQLAQRGEVDEARKLWELTRREKYFDDEDTLEGLATWASEPKKLLACCIYHYFHDAVFRDGANLKSIHMKLTELRREFPFLFSNDKEAGFEYARACFVDDLGRTLLARKPPAGSVEALLIECGNQPSGCQGGICRNVNAEDAERPKRAIYSLGVAAIPELGKLVEDRRLTRQIRPGFMRCPAECVRLGDLASQLLEEMTGAENLDAADPAWKQPGSEQRFFESAAVSRKDGKIAEFRETPLWVLGQKYPRSLLAFCDAIAEGAQPDTELFSLAESVANSKLTQQEKSDALANMCGRLKQLGPKRQVLQNLAKIDETRCATLLLPVLSQLPADVDEPYWKCASAGYTHVVMELRQDAVWKEYLKVVQRAAVGLRMEMMNAMNYSYNRQRRLAFLAAFLDDQTIRDPSVESGRYDGPCAAFTFKKIEVRDFVAEHIASILDFPDRPNEFWSAEEWSQLRKKVRTALDHEKLPTLTAE